MSIRRQAWDARVAIHAALTVGMGWLAVILALPGDTFATGRGWTRFGEMAGESTWAMVFWLVASVGVAGLTASGPMLRLFSVLTLSTAYGCVAMFMLWGAPSGSGSGTYTVLAGLGYYLAWRRTHEGV